MPLSKCVREKKKKNSATKKTKNLNTQNLKIPQGKMIHTSLHYGRFVRMGVIFIKKYNRDINSKVHDHSAGIVTIHIQVTRKCILLYTYLLVLSNSRSKNTQRTYVF